MNNDRLADTLRENSTIYFDLRKGKFGVVCMAWFEIRHRIDNAQHHFNGIIPCQKKKETNKLCMVDSPKPIKILFTLLRNIAFTCE